MRRWIGLAVVVLAGEAQAQIRVVPPLVTDRPDRTESSVVVPTRGVQLEWGVEVHRPARNKFVVGSAPLIRIGLGRGIELRLDRVIEGEYTSNLQSSGYRETTHDVTLFGLNPGAKAVRSVGERGAVGVIGQVDLDAPLRPTPIGGELIGLWAVDLSDRLGLSGNTGIALERRAHPAYWQTLSLAVGLGNRTGTYVEGYFDRTADGDWLPTLNGGLTVLLTPTVQLDLSGGSTRQAKRQTPFVGLGASVRW